MTVSSHHVRYDLVARTIQHYVSRGYEEIHTPWIVSHDVICATVSSEANVYELTTYHERERGCAFPVGSAEQGFIQLARDGQLVAGRRYVSAGPCYRNERVVDELHQRSFFKIELFQLMPFRHERCFAADVHEAMYRFVDDAEDCFNDLFPERRSLERRSLKDGSIDLEMNDVEVGSYGIRT